MIINNFNEKELEDLIIKSSNDYYSKGESSLTDKEFDFCVEKLRKLNPDNSVLSKLEIHNNNDWNYELENLPRKLFSIKKIKNQNDIENWKIFIQKQLGISYDEVQKLEICLSLKYDGIKILQYNKNFYTRYETGTKGYNVTSRIKNDIFNNNVDNSFEGELIISKENFKRYCSNYSSSRNFIPAIFSSKNKLNNQNKVDYIRYSIYNNSDTLDKKEQIILCNKYNKIYVPYATTYFKDLTEDLIFDFYSEYIEKSDFECDGVVLDINNHNLRNKLGETQKYLDCCRAYKGDILFNDIKFSNILSIDYQMSKYGKLTPVARIEPVKINEGIVSNVSLYNASYIKKENIHVGQKIEITRKGKINPKIIAFLSNDSIYDLPKKCPFCGSSLEWDENNVELFCSNPNCIEKKCQSIYYFFKTIGIKDFGLESIKAFVYKGNLNSINDFFDRNKIFNQKIEGIGDITKNNFFDNLDNIKINGVSLEKIQEASGFFEGIGASTLKLLNSINVDIEYLYKDSYYNEIYKKLLNIEGLGKKTIDLYLLNLENFYSFYSKIKSLVPIINTINTSKKDLSKYKVVFTGFRDEDLKNYIEENNGKVLSNVSSNCNYLIVKDLNSESSKMKKAKELGIEILEVENFKNIIYTK